MSTDMNQFNTQENVIGKDYLTSERAKAFVAQVFSWMFAALVLTATVAYLFATSDLIYFMFNEITGKPTPFFWIAMLSPIAIVLTMSFALERLNFIVLVGLFALYATLMGISMGTIFLVMYEPMQIVKAFAMTAGAFGLMAVAGYTTKADLSKFGMIMVLGLVGIVISSIFNMFIGSDSFGFLIDIVCIIVFTGLIAWKMQMVRQMGEEVGTSQPKMAVFMALSLYITFINLFMTILRLMRR